MLQFTFATSDWKFSNGYSLGGSWFWQGDDRDFTRQKRGPCIGRGKLLFEPTHQYTGGESKLDVVLMSNEITQKHKVSKVKISGVGGLDGEIGDHKMLSFDMVVEHKKAQPTPHTKDQYEPKKVENKKKIKAFAKHVRQGLASAIDTMHGGDMRTMRSSQMSSRNAQQ